MGPVKSMTANHALEPTGVNGLVSGLTFLVAGGSAFVR